MRERSWNIKLEEIRKEKEEKELEEKGGLVLMHVRAASVGEQGHTTMGGI